MKEVKALNINKIREMFQWLGEDNSPNNGIYMDSAASTLKPKVVIDVMSDFYLNNYSSIHRGSYKVADNNTIAYENSRERLKKFLNAGDEYSVIFTDGTTGAINLAAQCLREKVKTKDNVILSSILEHHSNYLPWKAIAAQTECWFEELKIDECGNIDLNTFDTDLLNEVKIAAFTHASNVTGKLQDLTKIISVLQKQGSIVLIDGAQSVPHVRVNLDEMSPDFFVTSAHKMLGPLGVGALVAKKSILEVLSPSRYGGGMVVNSEKMEWKSGYGKFEAGTPNFVGVKGWMAALDLLDEIGMDNVEEYVDQLTSYLRLRLNEIPNLQILNYCNREDNKVGILSFNIKNIHPHDIGAWLNYNGISVRVGHHCAQPFMKWLGIQSIVRVSLYIYNTMEEIDKLADCLMALVKGR